MSRGEKCHIIRMMEILFDSLLRLPENNFDPH